MMLATNRDILWQSRFAFHSRRKLMKKLLTLALLLLLALTACGTEIDPEAVATDAAALVATTVTNNEAEPTPVPWGYEGEDGPEHWGDAYETCNGSSQSPIDIVTTDVTDLVDLAFNYQPDTLELIHNGHTVQVNHHA